MLGCESWVVEDSFASAAVLLRVLGGIVASDSDLKTRVWCFCFLSGRVERTPEEAKVGIGVGVKGCRVRIVEVSRLYAGRCGWDDGNDYAESIMDK